jgi:enterochelin esterase-like enzyme
MGSTGATITRRQALSLAASSGAALAAVLSGLPKELRVLSMGDASAAAAAPATSPTALALSLQSRALAGTLRVAVYLPPGYSAGSRRYPVVYFLHGLPASPGSYLQLDWVARALAQSGREAILVVPQGTRVANGDPEYHNWGPGDDWETALADELPASIDSRYRTLPERSGRAIVPRLPVQFERYPTSFAFYVGSSDPSFVPANISLQRALTAAGVEHLLRLYAGGHTTALWQTHASAWLRLALDALAGAPVL